MALLSTVAPQAAKAYQVRITPWPIEPPLQIWRCPMGVSERAPMQSTAPKIWEASYRNGQALGEVILAQVAEGGADIDISGLEFDFVRSIRVWDVRYYCSESYNMRLGTYGTQGEFGWQRTTPAAAPKWVLSSRRCSSSSWRRGVGVEWEDHEGTHGYEWVAY